MRALRILLVLITALLLPLVAAQTQEDLSVTDSGGLEFASVSANDSGSAPSDTVEEEESPDIGVSAAATPGSEDGVMAVNITRQTVRNCEAVTVLITHRGVNGETIVDKSVTVEAPEEQTVVISIRDLPYAAGYNVDVVECRVDLPEVSNTLPSQITPDTQTFLPRISPADRNHRNWMELRDISPMVVGEIDPQNNYVVTGNGTIVAWYAEQLRDPSPPTPEHTDTVGWPIMATTSQDIGKTFTPPIQITANETTPDEVRNRESRIFHDIDTAIPMGEDVLFFYKYRADHKIAVLDPATSTVTRHILRQKDGDAFTPDELGIVDITPLNADTALLATAPRSVYQTPHYTLWHLNKQDGTVTQLQNITLPGDAERAPGTDHVTSHRNYAALIGSANRNTENGEERVLWYSRSVDGGNTFTPPRYLDLVDKSIKSTAISADGTLHAIIKSRKGQTTPPRKRTYTYLRIPLTGTPSARSISSFKGGRMSTPTVQSEGSQVWLAWNEKRDISQYSGSDATPILLTRSFDNGNTFHEPYELKHSEERRIFLQGGRNTLQLLPDGRPLLFLGIAEIGSTRQLGVLFDHNPGNNTETVTVDVRETEVETEPPIGQQDQDMQDDDLQEETSVEGSGGDAGGIVERFLDAFLGIFS